MRSRESNSVSLSSLRHGVVFMLVGLFWGMAIGFTPYPRLALAAHIQATTSGLVFLVGGLVVAHRTIGSSRAARAILSAAPWFVWGMVAAEIANAWWGTNQTLPIAAQQAWATGGLPWQEQVVKVAHVVGAIGVIAYWLTIGAALFRTSAATEAE